MGMCSLSGVQPLEYIGCRILLCLYCQCERIGEGGSLEGWGKGGTFGFSHRNSDKRDPMYLQ